MYATNDAVRSLAQQNAYGDAFRDKNLDRLREGHEAVFIAANNIKSPDERNAFLRRELRKARVELEGCGMHLKNAQSNFQGMDTLFLRNHRKQTQGLHPTRRE